MKKITTSILAFLLLTTFGFSQSSDLVKEVTKSYFIGKLDAAKTEIDKVMSMPNSSSNVEALAWQMAIDAEVINNVALNAKYPNLINSWLDNFKKYETLEPSYSTISTPPFNWKPVGLMYDKFFNDGRAAYGEKKWADAYASYDQCAHLAKVIMKKDLKKNGGALDTVAILMSGYSAQNAQKVKEAVYYYSIAADTKFGGANDIDIYKYLLFGYLEANNKEKFDKYYAIAKEKYPNESFEEYNLEFISRNMNIDEKVNYYNTEDAKGTLSVTAYTTFGDVFVAYKKTDQDPTSEKSKMIHQKAIDAFQKAFNKNNNPMTAYNAGVLLYNNFSDFDDAYRNNVREMQSINSNKPVEKDPKKKAAAEAKVKAQLEPLKKANVDIDVKMMASADDAITWLEKTYTILKDKSTKEKVEETSYRNSVKFLGQLYEYKREKAKSKDPKAYDAFDAKSKFYFAIFDKL